MRIAFNYKTIEMEGWCRCQFYIRNCKWSRNRNKSRCI